VDSHSSEVLGFSGIRERLAQKCPGDLGRERALNLGPLSDREAVVAELDRVDELLGLGEEPGVAGVTDIGSLLDRSIQGSVLTGQELLEVGKFCTAIRQYRDFFAVRQERAPKLWSVAEDLEAQPGLEKSGATFLTMPHPSWQGCGGR
jgi:dsDNA-specific endonuclease/ATPase MutS2